MSVSELRGIGRTTAQMKTAPKGAIFVWCNRYTDYPKRLAKELGRQDLIVVGTRTALQPGYFDGRRAPLVVDHAFGQFASPLEAKRMTELIEHFNVRMSLLTPSRPPCDARRDGNQT